MKNEEELKKKILYLVRFEQKSTTDIAWELKEPYWKIFALLERMRDQDNTIDSIKTKYFCYWKKREKEDEVKSGTDKEDN